MYIYHLVSAPIICAMLLKTKENLYNLAMCVRVSERGRERTMICVIE